MNVDFNKIFIKEQEKLTRAMQMRLDVRLSLFYENPFHPQLYNHALHTPFEGCRSINISGDLRAIYQLKGETALFIRLGTHSELYG